MTGKLALLAALLIAAPLGAASAPAQSPPPARELAYGDDPAHKLDFHPAATNAGRAPLLVFVHGGGWRRGDKSNATGGSQAAHFTAHGFAYASINYRLVPRASVEDQAADVANALAWLLRNAERLGIDSRRVVLMGHSAGAHLSALVATDSRYLKAAGLGLDRLAGVVLLDGAAYDIPAQRSDGPPIMQRTYAQAFGDEPDRQRALSPTFHAGPPNADNFLILHVDRADGRRQSEALAGALRGAGVRVELAELPGRGLAGHMRINRSLGEPDYPGTAVVDRWLAKVSAR